MSLVNKMLRDLDARRAGEAERGVLPAAVTPLPEDTPRVSRSRMAALLVAAVLAASGLAAYFGFLPSQGVSTPPRAPLSKAPTLPPTPPSAMPLPAARPASTVATTATTPVVAAPAAAKPPPVAAPPAPAAAPPLPPSAAGVRVQGLRLAIDLDRLPGPKSPPATKAAAKPAASAKVTPAPTAPVAPAPATEEARVDKQMVQPTGAEKAEAEFRRGQQAQRQGADDEAAARYRAALAEQPEHAAARRTLVNLLIDHRRHDEAEDFLRRGIALFPTQAYWPMALSRLRVERGDTTGALDILKKHAAAGEASADYQGFAGALLHRVGQDAEAVGRYQAASRLAPNEARWWAGLGIALEGAGRPAEARAAYERARSLPGLPAELATHIEQRLR